MNKKWITLLVVFLGIPSAWSAADETICEKTVLSAYGQFREGLQFGADPDLLKDLPLSYSYTGSIYAGNGHGYLIFPIRLGASGSEFDQVMGENQQIIETTNYDKMFDVTNPYNLRKDAMTSVLDGAQASSKSVQEATRYVLEPSDDVAVPTNDIAMSRYSRRVRDTRIRSQVNVKVAIDWANFLMALPSEGSLNWYKGKSVDKILAKEEISDVAKGVRVVLQAMNYLANKQVESNLSIDRDMPSQISGRVYMLVYRALHEVTKMKDQGRQLSVLDSLYTYLANDQLDRSGKSAKHFEDAKGNKLSLEEYVLYLSGKPRWVFARGFDGQPHDDNYSSWDNIFELRPF